MVNEIYEFTIDKKKEGKYLLARMLMVCLYVVIAVAFFVFCYLTKLIQIFAVAPLLIWILSYFTWRYVSIEYKYVVSAGFLKLYVVYGGKKAKEKASFHIKEAIGFIHLNDASDEIRDFRAKRTYNFLSSMKSAKDPYAFMIKSDGVNTIVLIEAPEPSRKAILYYATDSVRAGRVEGYGDPC